MSSFIEKPTVRKVLEDVVVWLIYKVNGADFRVSPEKDLVQLWQRKQWVKVESPSVNEMIERHRLEVKQCNRLHSHPVHVGRGGGSFAFVP